MFFFVKERNFFLYNKIVVRELLVKLLWCCFCYEMVDLLVFIFGIYYCDEGDKESEYIFL